MNTIEILIGFSHNCPGICSSMHQCGPQQCLHWRTQQITIDKILIVVTSNDPRQLMDILTPGQGRNPRFEHTFIDEDGMRWVKCNLYMQWWARTSATLGIMCKELGFAHTVQWCCQLCAHGWGMCAKAHPLTRHNWLLKCGKLRPWFSKTCSDMIVPHVSMHLKTWNDFVASCAHAQAVHHEVPCISTKAPCLHDCFYKYIHFMSKPCVALIYLDLTSSKRSKDTNGETMMTHTFCDMAWGWKRLRTSVRGCISGNNREWLWCDMAWGWKRLRTSIRGCISGNNREWLRLTKDYLITTGNRLS